MSIFIKKSGIWQEADEIAVKQQDEWKNVRHGYVKRAGAWEEVFEGYADYSVSSLVASGLEVYNNNVYRMRASANPQTLFHCRRNTFTKNAISVDTSFTPNESGSSNTVYRGLDRIGNFFYNSRSVSGGTQSYFEKRDLTFTRIENIRFMNSPYLSRSGIYIGNILYAYQSNSNTIWAFPSNNTFELAVNLAETVYMVKDHNGNIATLTTSGRFREYSLAGETLVNWPLKIAHASARTFAFASNDRVFFHDNTTNMIYQYDAASGRYLGGDLTDLSP